MECSNEGVFLLRVGSKYLVASSPDIAKTVADHTQNLQFGVHENQELQDEFDRTDSQPTMEIVTPVPRKPIDTDKDHGMRLLLHEQFVLDRHFRLPGCVNTSQSSGYTRKSPKRTPRPKPRSNGYAPPREFHPMSKPCVLLFRGERLEFPSINHAAAHLGIYQQILGKWLKGEMKWPGEPRPIRNRKPGTPDPYLHLHGLTGWMVGNEPSPLPQALRPAPPSTP
jgi:hypothetical protein